MRTTDLAARVEAPFKRWLTAAEIAAVSLPGAPASTDAASRYVGQLREDGSPHLWRARQDGAAGIEIHYSALPLDAVVAYEARNRGALAAAQPHDKRLARFGTSVLATAEGGRLRAFIVQRLVAEPRSPVVAIRDRCCERFGTEVVILAQGLPTLVPMPSFRTFQGFVLALRETGATDARR